MNFAKYLLQFLFLDLRVRSIELFTLSYFEISLSKYNIK